MLIDILCGHPAFAYTVWRVLSAPELYGNVIRHAVPDDLMFRGAGLAFDALIKYPPPLKNKAFGQSSLRHTGQVPQVARASSSGSPTKASK